MHGYKTNALLTDNHGVPFGDVAAPEETLMRVSTLTREFPQVAELDVVAKGLDRGATIVDALTRVAEMARHYDPQQLERLEDRGHR